MQRKWTWQTLNQKACDAQLAIVNSVPDDKGNDDGGVISMQANKKLWNLIWLSRLCTDEEVRELLKIKGFKSCCCPFS